MNLIESVKKNPNCNGVARDNGKLIKTTDRFMPKVESFWKKSKWWI